MSFGLRKNKRFYIVRVLLIYALILICLALPITVSRYLTRAGGDDSAEVAQFDVSQTGTLTETLNLEFGELWTKDYQIVLDNKGEVDVTYTVTFTRATENLPLTFTWDGDVEQELLKSGEQITHTLTVSWTGSRDHVYSGTLDRVQVSVICEQVD